jgi:hypothetical protein
VRAGQAETAPLITAATIMICLFLAFVFAGRRAAGESALASRPPSPSAHSACAPSSKPP